MDKTEQRLRCISNGQEGESDQRRNVWSLAIKYDTRDWWLVRVANTPLNSCRYCCGWISTDVRERRQPLSTTDPVINSWPI